MKIRYVLLPSILFFSIFLTGASIIEVKPWPIPPVAAKKANPVKSSPESISSGKQLWLTQCSACHGRTGLGDGRNAIMLQTPMSDFTTQTFQSQSDGSVFYKISEGRQDMPSFKKKITNQQEIWDLVNFIRTLKQ